MNSKTYAELSDQQTQTPEYTAEDIALVCLEGLSHEEDNPMVWDFLRELGNESQEVVDFLVSLRQGIIDPRFSRILESLIGVGMAYAGNPASAHQHLESLLANNEGSTLIGGALSHVEGLLS